MPRTKGNRSRLDKKWMPLIRGAQSAIFYYVSCAPCHKLKHQRRLEQQEDANKVQRRAYHDKADYDTNHEADTGTDDPAVPVNIQPMPQGTNKYWKEEMRTGPGPPPARVSKLPPKLKAMAYARRDLPPQKMTHQRHDSEVMLAHKVAQEPEIKGEANSYSLPRPPPVNDLHPPVVRLPIFSSEPGNIRFNQEPTPRPSLLLGHPHSKAAPAVIITDEGSSEKGMSAYEPAIHFDPYKGLGESEA